MVTEPSAGAAAARDGEEVWRVVEAIDVEAGFREQMGVPSLPAGDVEDTRPRREREDLEQARDLAAVALRREDRLVLEEIVGVEVMSPPVGAADGAGAPGRTLAGRAQKNTGSRYAPNTSSIAARIS
jgi:hypothetical protein